MIIYRVVDRDMFMHFTGGGIGHLSTQVSTQVFEDEIQSLWGMAIVEEHTDDNDSSDMDNNLDNLGQDFILEEPEIEKGEEGKGEEEGEEEREREEEEEEGWYTDQESDEENNLNDLADNGNCIEDESALGYKMS